MKKRNKLLYKKQLAREEKLKIHNDGVLKKVMDDIQAEMVAIILTHNGKQEEISSQEHR